MKFSSLGAPLFILMIFNLSYFNGLKEIKDNLFSILSISILATLTLQFLNKSIDISKWVQENLQNKLIFATNNMLIFHLPMLKSFSKKRCMMKSLKSYHLLRQCQMLKKLATLFFHKLSSNHYWKNIQINNQSLWLNKLLNISPNTSAMMIERFNKFLKLIYNLPNMNIKVYKEKLAFQLKMHSASVKNIQSASTLIFYGK